MDPSEQRPDTITLVSAEDDRLLSTFLTTVLHHEPDVRVVASVWSGADALEAVKKLKPRVLLLDLNLPDGSGLSVLNQLAERGDEVAVLILSGDECVESQVEAARAGARGFLGKSSAARLLPGVIRKIAQGETYFSNQVTSRVLRDFVALNRQAHQQRHPLSPLTEREREVFIGVARGLSNPELSRELFMSVSTVKSHLRSALDKLRLSSRTDAVVFSVREGLLPERPSHIAA